MHPDGEITILGGVPIGIAVMCVGLYTGIGELTLTGIGMAGAACVVGFLFDLAAPDGDAELLS